MIRTRLTPPRRHPLPERGAGVDAHLERANGQDDAPARGRRWIRVDPRTALWFGKLTIVERSGLGRSRRHGPLQVPNPRRLHDF